MSRNPVARVTQALSTKLSTRKDRRHIDVLDGATACILCIRFGRYLGPFAHDTTLELYLRRLLERAKISTDSDHRICQSADKRIELTWFATETFRFHINFKSIWLWSRIPRLPHFYGKLCFSNVHRRVERWTDCSIILSNKKLLFYFWNGPSNSFMNKICDHDSLYTLENCMLTSNVLSSTQVLLIECSPLVSYSGRWFHPLNSSYRD